MKKQHANILLGIIGIVAVLGILMASAGAWYFFKTIHRTTADEQGAAAAFNDARATFKGAMPLIELRPGGPVLTRPLPGVGPSTKLHTLHYLAWNRENQRLTRADIPFALLRLKEGPVDLMRFSRRPGTRWSGSWRSASATSSAPDRRCSSPESARQQPGRDLD